ncbi:MAG TPA: hypothetical protein VFO78_12705 [Candidatus Limnocylindrales bacterium]|nr:hypothetical protein [Candidatus Limnocylindrales bacterium]
MTAPRSMIRLLVLTGLIAVLAACGGATARDSDGNQTSPEPTIVTEATAAPDGDTPEPGTDLDACEILTPADIETATDTSGVAEGEFEATPTVLSPGHTECTYEGDFGGVIVALTPEDGENLYDAAAGAYKDMVLLEGLGDGAFFSADNHRAFVWQGNVTVMFTLFVNGDLDAATVAEAFGEAVVAKL